MPQEPPDRQDRGPSRGLHRHRTLRPGSALHGEQIFSTFINGRTWAHPEKLRRPASRASAAPVLVVTNIETKSPVKAAFRVHLRGGTGAVCSDKTESAASFLPYSAQWYIYGIPGTKIFNSTALRMVCHGAKPQLSTPEATRHGGWLHSVQEGARGLGIKLP